jgi:WD40 repeat protein
MDNKRELDFLKKEATITDATFSPDSKWLITKDGNDNSKVWSVETGKQYDFLKDEKTIRYPTFSPDSKWLITTDGNHNYKVWSVETGKNYDFLKDEKNIYKATFSQDAKLLSIITQHQVKTYEVATGKLIQTLWLNKEPYRINIIDNRYLYVTVGKAIVKTDLETQRGKLMSFGDGEELDYKYDEIQEWIKALGDQYLLPLDEEIKKKYGITD